MINFDKITKDIIPEHLYFDYPFRMILIRALSKRKTICSLGFLNDFNVMEKISL